jgi:hypothetical protein
MQELGPPETRRTWRDGSGAVGLALDAIQERVLRGSSTLDPALEAVSTRALLVGSVERLRRATFEHLGLDAAARQRAVCEHRGDRGTALGAGHRVAEIRSSTGSREAPGPRSRLRSEMGPAPQSIPFASRVRCLVALGAGRRRTALGPGPWPQGQPRTPPYSHSSRRERLSPMISSTLEAAYARASTGSNSDAASSGSRATPLSWAVFERCHAVGPGGSGRATCRDSTS